MSHQMKVKTQIKSLVALKEALDELGYSYAEQGQLNDYRGGRVGEIDLTVTVGGHSDRVGFQKSNDETYDLVGDFYQTGGNEATFRAAVTKTYMKKQVRSLLKKKRYTVVNETVDDKGWTVIRGRSMVA